MSKKDRRFLDAHGVKEPVVITNKDPIAFDFTFVDDFSKSLTRATSSWATLTTSAMLSRKSITNLMAQMRRDPTVPMSSHSSGHALDAIGYSLQGLKGQEVTFTWTDEAFVQD